MNGQQEQQKKYIVKVYESEGDSDDFKLSFNPKGLQPHRINGEKPTRVPQYIVSVHGKNGSLNFDWSGTPDDPGEFKEELEQETRARLQARAEWIDRVSSLVDQVEVIGKELGWATRRIDKKLEDSYIGNHRVPGLLLQEGFFRILLEPVGRSAPGTQGVVDLYLMPAYDDMASLYYYNGQWNLHYLFPGVKGVSNTREAPARPLTKETLREVLAEMQQYAA